MTLRRIVPTCVFVGLTAGAIAQRVGDHPTAGVTFNRTHFNAHMGDFGPPLRLIETIDLAEVEDAQSLIAFEGRVLVGEKGYPNEAPAKYHLYSAEGRLWSVSLPDGFLSGGFGPAYEPAYASGRVILGGERWNRTPGELVPEAESVFVMVDAESGTVIWEASAEGRAARRSPVLTNDLAVFHSEGRVTAAHAATGEVFWRYPATDGPGETGFEGAPVSVYGNRAYVLALGGGRGLHALDLRTGELLWVNEGAWGPTVIATEKLVYVGDRAIDATSGATAWTIGDGGAPYGAAPASVALAHGRLFATWRVVVDPFWKMLARQADTGDPLWERTKPAPVSLFPIFDTSAGHFPVVANNLLCFYNRRDQRVRVLDAFTGTLLWSMRKPGVRAMAAADGRLLLLFARRVEVYSPSNEIHLPQVAGGAGLSTLLTLGNPSPRPAAATVFFLDGDGSALLLPVDGADGDVSEVSLTIPAESAAAVRVAEGGGLRTGWARVVSDLPLRGTAVFQARSSGEVEREVAVADAPATGWANVRVDSREDFGTALAVVNVADEPAGLRLRLLDEEGNVAAEGERELPPGAHLARFVGELFDDPGLDLVDFEGTLVLESDMPVSVTALRTRRGAFVSSHPVGRPVR
jgi:outer membrane protein assembly factor BamB